MRIRKQLNSYPHHHAFLPSPKPPPPPPDLFSTTHDQGPDPSLNITIKPPFHSQEQHDQYPISQSVCDDTKKYFAPQYFVSQDERRNFYLLKDDHQPSLINPSPVNMMRSKINISIFSNQNPAISLGEEEEEERTSEEKRTITSISDIQSSFCGSTTSAETSAATASSVSSSLSGHGSWCEEEKLFPVKKRRISLERFITQESSTKDKARQRKKGVKAWINNSCLQVRTAKTEDEIKIWGDYSANKETEREKKIIKEENLTRCTRRNGKGRRCVKRRVEGNSLCKHHINMLKIQQYRLKNGQNCRPRNGSNTAAGKIETRVQKCWDLEDQDHDDDGAGKCFGGVGKKRKKVMMSSLLHRTVPLLAAADTL